MADIYIYNTLELSIAVSHEIMIKLKSIIERLKLKPTTPARMLPRPCCFESLLGGRELFSPIFGIGSQGEFVEHL